MSTVLYFFSFFKQNSTRGPRAWRLAVCNSSRRLTPLAWNCNERGESWIGTRALIPQERRNHSPPDQSINGAGAQHIVNHAHADRSSRLHQHYWWNGEEKQQAEEEEGWGEGWGLTFAASTPMRRAWVEGAVQFGRPAAAAAASPPPRHSASPSPPLRARMDGYGSGSAPPTQPYSFYRDLFSSKIFCKIDTAAFSFVFDKNYPIMD